jgi:hypothetical protein
VVTMVASQLMKTQIALNWMGGLIHMAPSNILALLPSLGLSKRVSGRISKTIKATPVLRERPHTFHYMDPPYWQTAGYGVDFPFENYERIADFMRRCKGKVMVSINDHPDIRRVFEGFHFETLDIRYSNTNQRQVKAEVSGELVIMNWEPAALGGLF